MMDAVKETLHRDIILVELRFQLQAIYEVLDIMGKVINNLQKNGMPYHRLYWEKERVMVLIEHTNCLCYLS